MDAAKVKPRILTLTQSTYDGVLYNTETIKSMLDGYVDNLHFDEAWLPHAAFHPFYGTYHAMGKNRAPQAFGGVRHAVHPQAAGGISQASHVLVQDSQHQAGPHLFNEAYLMHTSTSPQYSIIASCDVAAAMMEPPGGTALVERALPRRWIFRRAMRQGGRRVYGKTTGGSGLGPGELADEGVGRAETGSQDRAAMAKQARPCQWLARFGQLADGFNMLDPIKSTIVTPGLEPERQFAKTGIRRPS